MINNKTIITDVDDVLLHFGWKFQEWLKIRKNIHISQNVVDSYSIENALELSFSEIEPLIYEFFNDNFNGSCIPPYTDAQIILPRLHKEGWEFHALTAAPDEEWMYVWRKVNLTACFGPIFKTINHLGHGKPKSESLRNFEKSYFVEDNLEHAKGGHDTGHTVFLKDKKGNRYQNISGITRIKSWYCIYKFLGNNRTKSSIYL